MSAFKIKIRKFINLLFPAQYVCGPNITVENGIMQRVTSTEKAQNAMYIYIERESEGESERDRIPKEPVVIYLYFTDQIIRVILTK